MIRGGGEGRGREVRARRDRGRGMEGLKEKMSPFEVMARVFNMNWHEMMDYWTLL